ncbi:MAG: M48 family metallopeptidase [Aureispira sp.]
MNKVIEHPILGAILYKKNKRSKNITIRVKEGGKVQVSMPYRAPYQEAMRVVNQHIHWIEEQLVQSVQLQAQKALDWDSNFTILNRPLTLEPYSGNSPQMESTVEQIRLLVPQDWDFKDKEQQQVLQKIMIELLRILAKEYLPQRTHYWANYHQIKIGEVRVKHVKTRWGSCSSKGNINLSVHLMLLPSTWIDYVICHELAHIKHANHSPAFWAHLEQLLPGAKQLDKALNQYSRPF